jgi:hypothetical protein
MSTELGPMNGQRYRQDLVRSLFRNVDLHVVIETGTYRGSTTLFLQHVSGVEVFSVELLSRFERYAIERCRPNKQIALRMDDSRAFLRTLVQRHGTSRSFFYLDAHWQADSPRFDELELIRDHWSSAIVMIDDFHVPTDRGYASTSYAGKRLDLDYLPDLPGWHAYFPTTPSETETGARRGCVILCTEDLAPSLANINLLARHPLNLASR